MTTFSWKSCPRKSITKTLFSNTAAKEGKPLSIDPAKEQSDSWVSTLLEAWVRPIVRKEVFIGKKSKTLQSPHYSQLCIIGARHESMVEWSRCTGWSGNIFLLHFREAMSTSVPANNVIKNIVNKSQNHMGWKEPQEIESKFSAKAGTIQYTTQIGVQMSLELFPLK